MSRDDVIKMAREAGLAAILEEHAHEYGNGTFENTPYPALERFFKLAFEAGRKAEQVRCCAIVIGLAGSDNVAHRTVKAIRSDK